MFARLFIAHFKGLVLHFHNELLLLFLPGARFLKLGLHAVDLHLVFHHCGERAGDSHLTNGTQSLRKHIIPAFVFAQGGD